MRHEKENAPFLLDQTDFGLLQNGKSVLFWIVLLILAVSAGLSQILPLAVGYLTDRVLVDRANISLSNYRTSPSGDPDHQCGQ